jgi:lysozyme
MIFNLGATRLLGFKKFLKAVEENDFDLASTEMLDSRWAKQVGQRSIELSEFMKNGYTE